ncbi:MAG: hypothetical protein K0M70_04345 [Arenimonas sp.]|uniref:hypothetical protein n=1 Tax=Arenimonas sp. TaxID=1872635 RepID=UPI0025BAAB5C|nr:hypothetical protein [Arenimonas sp.]MBW8367071.1 hypothetical protein [Arenimonas sp.]
MSDLPVTGEVSNSKLAAVFDSQAAAGAARDAVVSRAGLQPAQVKLISPAEPHPNIKLQPEGKGIWRTIVLAHLWFGVGGLVAGALAWAVLMWLGVALIVSSALVSAVAFVFMGAIAGLMLGGLVALRPDQDRYVQATQDAIADRRFSVVVHALSRDEADRAASVLTGLGAEVTRTL